MRYTFDPTKNKARPQGWKCGKGSGATKKINFIHTYPQEPSLTESLKAVETLYTLALFCSHEPELANVFNIVSNVQSHLKAERRNTLRTSKITSYFHSTGTETRGAVDSETDGGDVIWVD